MRWLVLLLLLWASPASALTLRYAIVIGNNRGAKTPAGQLPDLLHAEREAIRLHTKLIELCNFDPSPKRTVLLTGPTRSEVEDAVSALVEQIKLDEQRYGRTRKMFAFFFTGHGQSGRLVLDDGMLQKAALGQIFKRIGADLNIGVFDACYSASLSPGSLMEKGVRPTPGQNVFNELPQEVLNAEGSVWFVSSGADQPSYEDRRLGGVFTHYLIEALERASPDGPGISLERIWRYAHEKTVSYTTERHRPQHPEKIVRKLRSGGALYFSFPGARDSTLILGAQVKGRFLLSYKEGLLTERIDKRPGEQKRVSVYPGPARLMLLEKGEIKGQEQLELRPGGRIVVSAALDQTRPAQKLDERVEELWAKGFDGQLLTARRIEPRVSVLAGISAGYAGARAGLLSPRQTIAATSRFDRGLFTAELSAGYGHAKERFSAWGYTLRAPFGRGAFGLGGYFSSLRIAGLVALEGGPLLVRYDDGAKKTGWFLAPGGQLSLAHPISERFAVALNASAAILLSEGAGISAQRTISFYGGASAAIWVRIF